MRLWSWIGMGLAVGVVGGALAIAQQPGGRGRPGESERPGARGPRDNRPPPNPLIEALDADGDHVISAKEIEGAAAALRALDKNQDGQISEEELHPHRSGPRDGRGPDRGGEGPPPRRDAGPQGGPRGGPPEGRGFGGPPRDGFGGPPPRRGEGPQGDRRGPQGDPRGGPQGPPRHDPAQFVAHAMEFDADGDGMLSRDELKKFAEQMPGPPGGGGPGGRGPGARGPGGRGPDGPGGRGPGGGESRPSRPARPPSDN